MIIFHEGSPGSGKTYDAIVKILANLRKKRKVYTNIDGLSDSKCREMIKCKSGLDDYEIDLYLRVMNREHVLRFWEIAEKGSMIVIDEMHKYFNARDWQTQENRRCADWCSTHRHYGFDAIFITQRIEKVDTQIRTLTEWTYAYKKVNMLGSFINKTYICFAYSGDDTSQALTRKVSRYDAEIFGCYKSYISKDVKELKIQTHANILKHPVFIMIPIAIIATIYFIVKSTMAHHKGNGILEVNRSKIQSDINQSRKSINQVNNPMNVPVLQHPVQLKAVPDVKNALTQEKPVEKNDNVPVKYENSKKDEVKEIAIVNGKKIKLCNGEICEKY